MAHFFNFRKSNPLFDNILNLRSSLSQFCFLHLRQLIELIRHVLPKCLFRSNDFSSNLNMPKSSFFPWEEVHQCQGPHLTTS